MLSLLQTRSSMSSSELNPLNHHGAQGAFLVPNEKESTMQQLCFAGWPVAGCLEESQLSKSIEWIKRAARRLSDSLNVGVPV